MKYERDARFCFEPIKLMISKIMLEVHIAGVNVVDINVLVVDAI